MRIRIVRQQLTPGEIASITRDIRAYPDLTYVHPDLWKTFSEHFVAYIGDEFVGTCAVIRLNKWMKIGPLAIRKNHRNKGIGTALLAEITSMHRSSNLYIGSSNPTLAHITAKMHFQKISFFRLPHEIQRYLTLMLLRLTHPMLVFEAVRKTVRYGKNRYSYFIKPA